jgi:hypothetical protein
LIASDAVFEVGREIDFGTVRFDEGTVTRYLTAVQDEAMARLNRSSGEQWVPPLAIAAQFSKGVSEMDLPLEALHTGQELDFLKPVAIDSEIRCTGRVVFNRQRGEVALVQIEFEGQDAMGDIVIHGKTTLLLPSGAGR